MLICKFLSFILFIATLMADCHGGMGCCGRSLKAPAFTWRLLETPGLCQLDGKEVLLLLVSLVSFVNFTFQRYCLFLFHFGDHAAFFPIMFF